MRLHPFRAVRPPAELASQVAAVPYDVVSRDEAAELARDNPYSFLHVGRSDIDLPPETDPHDPLIYDQAREALDRFIAEGILVKDREPALYLYRQIMDGRVQTGIVGCVHIDDYEQRLIRKHEKTRPDKEDDRTRHVLTLNAHAEPVFLAYRGRTEIDVLAEQCWAPRRSTTSRQRTGCGTRSGRWAIRHLWTETFRAVPHAYVADGHHRSRECLAGGTGAPGCQSPRTGATKSTTGSWRCCFRPASSRYFLTIG